MANAAARPIPDPDQREHGPLPEHQPQHVARLRTDRHPDGQLRHPLGRDVGNHAIEPHGGQQQREHTEGCGECRGGPLHIVATAVNRIAPLCPLGATVRCWHLND